MLKLSTTLPSGRSYIETLCYRELDSHREILRLRVIDRIVENSECIFLWTHLVLDNILTGPRNGDSIADLRSEVDEFSPELDDLYDKLREPTERSESDKKSPRQILGIATETPESNPISPFAILWLLDDDDPRLADKDFPPET
ncbi:hypothetical protein BD289DRAFT_453790 [Coniella lustricola]|uniref:Uncharacterized protein n=1 Tax=Coniella lustricola TaxID=2025994 RepID=A0A2T3A5W6_9PEZI|nr:hypothetical protein BD289DRAFT_453790 [Coniella lustricola]